jgi:prevent-host-death family protein
MRSVNIREARQQLSNLVDAAEHGESVLIMRHGKQVARLEPAGPTPGGPLPDLSDFRDSIRRVSGDKGESLSKAVTEARRRARY